MKGPRARVGERAASAAAKNKAERDQAAAAASKEEAEKVSTDVKEKKVIEMCNLPVSSIDMVLTYGAGDCKFESHKCTCSCVVD